MRCQQGAIVCQTIRLCRGRYLGRISRAAGVWQAEDQRLRCSLEECQEFNSGQFDLSLSKSNLQKKPTIPSQNSTEKVFNSNNICQRNRWVRMTDKAEHLPKHLNNLLHLLPTYNSAHFRYEFRPASRETDTAHVVEPSRFFCSARLFE